MFESAVDGFGGSVAGAWPVEEREDVGRALSQGACEPADLDKGGGDAGADRVDHSLHHLLAALLVGFPIGGDDALVDAPGRFDLDVLVAGEQCCQACALLVGEEIIPGVQGAARTVEGVTRAATVPSRGLLDALPAPIVLTPSNRCGSSMRRRLPSARIALFAVCQNTPRPAAARETVRWSTTSASSAQPSPPREIFALAGAARVVSCRQVRRQ